ncbi:MAG: hypothetical protein HON90_13230 [Halobacteriovoraceae bacterium]|nr:hypothetical protein [Halobacteriovoraceae bacterium]
MDITEFIEKFPNNLPKHEPVFIDTKNQKKLLSVIFQLKLCFKDISEYQLKEYSEILQLYYQDKKNESNMRFKFVYFPWIKNEIYKIVEPKIFYELVTWRNKLKINEQEQKIISNKKLTIIGSSVGSFTTKILSKSGFQHFKIAELKNMKPSNTPRMYCDSLRHYGVHKIYPLMESIYEFNPYSNIQVFNEGMNEVNINYLFNDADIIFDCADDPRTKLRIHSEAKKRELPLITGFDELGCLIVFRYDKPEIMVHHLPNFDIDEIEELKKTNLENYILKLIDFIPGKSGVGKLSKRQQDTIAYVLKGNLGGFSQLAWEAAQFGSSTAKAAIDVSLGSDIEGVYFVNLDDIFNKNNA